MSAQCVNDDRLRAMCELAGIDVCFSTVSQEYHLRMRLRAGSEHMLREYLPLSATQKDWERKITTMVDVQQAFLMKARSRDFVE